MESLPNELKRYVLKAAPNVTTLSALVHSSPIYHAVYLTMREECLTQVTIRDLKSRDMDILEPASWFEVSLRDGQPPDADLKLALKACQQQVRMLQPIMLTVPQCCSLMRLTDICPWTRKLTAHTLTIECPRIYPMTYTTSLLPLNPGEGAQLVIPRVRHRYPCAIDKYHLVIIDGEICSREEYMVSSWSTINKLRYISYQGLCTINQICYL